MYKSRALITAVALTCLAEGAAHGATELLNPRDLSIQPTTGNAYSASSAASADGRFVAFASGASDFVSGDTNQRSDIFVLDRSNGTLTRVSVSSSGVQANSDSSQPAISPDGRFVAFVSLASNLVPHDTNDGQDVFVHDRQTRTTTRVSVNSSGQQATAGAELPESLAPAITVAGRFVVFVSNATNLVSGLPDSMNRIFLRDTLSNTTSVMSIDSRGMLANQSSGEPAISPDGLVVAFTSSATNLAANDTNGVADVFIRDRGAGTTTRVSVDSRGAQANGASGSPAVNTNGRYVAFQSSATNLAAGMGTLYSNIFLKDRQSGATTLVSTLPNGPEEGEAAEPSISGDGNFIAYRAMTHDDFPAVTQIFVANRQSGAVRQVTFGPSTASADISGSREPAVSGNGRLLFLTSSAYNFVTGDGNDADDVFAFDNQSAAFSLVSTSKLYSRTAPGGGSTNSSALSRDGRYAAFTSASAVLTPGDSNGWPDVFVTDRASRALKRVSVNSNGEQGDDYSRDAAISADSRSIAFMSWAHNLSANDVAQQDVFVYNQASGITTLESADSRGNGAYDDSFGQSISADGRFVAFTSFATNLVPEPVSAVVNVFVRDRRTGAVTLVSKNSRGIPGDGASFDPSISHDGRFVVFTSSASNFVPGDSFGTQEAFIHDRRTGTTRRFVVGPSGVPANDASGGAVISGNGRYVAFFSAATNLVGGGSPGGLFIRDLQRGVNTFVTADGGTPSFSAEGRFVAFSSASSDLVPGDTNHVEDVFVYDQLTGLMSRESLAADGSQGNGDSIGGALSADGRVIAFTSLATNFAADDNNGTYDVFARVRQIPTAVRINAGGPGFTDSSGHFWAADRGFNTGSASTFTAPIGGTNDAMLYQTERWDAATSPELQYSIPVPDGKYLVRLHFAENSARRFSVGARVFDVDLEGVRAFEDVDVFKAVGARKALVKSASTTVKDGKLDILFRHQVQNPIIDAIEILGQ